MKRTNNNLCPIVLFDAGFSLLELVTVIALIGILAAIAIPSFVQWSQNASYTSASRTIEASLRDARSKAIAVNLQFRMEFGPGNGPTYTEYGLRTGNRANNTDWTDQTGNPPVSQWTSVPPGVFFTASSPVVFSPSGISNAQPGQDIVIAIQDSAGNVKSHIGVAATGRIRIY